jgi:ankyrin repeat protein
MVGLNQPTPPLERRRVAVYRQQLKRLENRTHRDDSRLTMKSQLIAIVAAVVLVGCGESQQSASTPESKPAKSVNPKANKALLNAVKKGDIEAAKQAITDGADVNGEGEYGMTPIEGTPLHLAVSQDRHEIIELIIAKGANVNVKDMILTLTPLDWAVKLGKTETIKVLQKHGGKSAAQDSIHTAAQLGNFEAVKNHLDNGTDINSRAGLNETPLDYTEESNNKLGIGGLPEDTLEIKAAKKEIADFLRKRGGKHSSIFEAAKGGDSEGIKEFLAAGVDPDEKTGFTFGQTPLHVASTKEVAEVLIEKGADVNAIGNGYTPLDFTIKENRKEIADLLRKHGGKTRAWLKAGDAIYTAARAGHIEAVKQHLAKGIDVNEKQGNGETSLHAAAEYGHKETAELLIKEGTDVNQRILFGRLQGMTPLDLAIWKKQTETVELLRKHGGKTGDWLKAGDSIHIAAKVGHIEAVKKHLADGADVNAIGKFRKASPLYMAAYSYNAEVTKFLLENGADIHQLDFENETALHTAAYHSYHGEGDVSVVALLVDHGSKINAISDRGLTPLDLAIMTGVPEIADLLRKHGGKTAEELEVKLTFNSDGTVSNSTHKLLAGWKFNEVDNNKTSIKTTAGLPLTLRVNIEQARPNGKGGLAIPALNPNESLSVRLEHNDLGEKLFSEYVVGVKVKIISSLTSEFFSIFDTGQPHPDGFYATEEENLQYKADAEIYVKDNEGIGILGDYVGGEKIINDEYNWFIIEIKEDLDFLVINKYINGEHVGTQRERSLFGTKRYKLQAGKEAKPVSFFVDNDSETKPCIVSEIFLSVPVLLRNHGGKRGVELKAEGK